MLSLALLLSVLLSLLPLAYLAPLQVGCCCPFGAEAAVHTARQWCQRNSTESDKVALKLDFSNAFNSINRAHLLEEVREHFPELARWPVGGMVLRWSQPPPI